jgi:thiol-disulfide isomerase/thioredoxin
MKIMTKNLVRVALGLVLGVSILVQPYSTLAGPRVSASAPNFQFQGPGAKTYSLADLRGTVVVIDFWASWCPACRRSLPQLEALNKKYQNENVVFIGVNDEDRETIDKFSRSNHLHFFTIEDRDDEIGQAFNVDAIPNTFVIDKQGRIAATIEGFDGSEDDLQSAIDNALDDK